MPILLIGANVDNKPNFMAIAWCGIANADPPMISLAIRKNRYTLKGINQNMTVSVNIPSRDLLMETDYCGMVSGSEVDKADVCKFSVFYGKLYNAPLIEQCPINLECKVIHTLDLGTHSFVIGQIEETHVSDGCMTEGQPDVDKINPIAYIGGSAKQYQAMGEVLANAFSIGKELEAKE
ncbi:flavin reductase family protein [Chloroflexota bacterium]